MKKLEKGFTLIELMIVVAIIAILAAVAAPRFGQQIKKAQDAKAVQVVGSWRSGLNIHYADTMAYATTFGALDTFVDAGTKGKTYTTAGTDTTATDTKRFTDAGTSTLAASVKHVQFDLGTGEITFATGNGNNTATKAWSTF